MKRKSLGLIVAVLMPLIFAINAQSDEPSASTSGKENQEAKPPEAPASASGLLMNLLGKAGLAQPLDKAGINIYGYIEGGYFHDFSSPSRGSGPTFIGFNSYKNAGTLDKISLNVERAVDPTKKKLDFGFSRGRHLGYGCRFRPLEWAL